MKNPVIGITLDAKIIKTILSFHGMHLGKTILTQWF